MTNKLFIVKYIFVVVDVNIDIIVFKNFDTNLNKRKSFDDVNFNIIAAQNVYFLDVANDVANKINSLKSISNIASEIKIINEVRKI